MDLNDLNGDSVVLGRVTISITWTCPKCNTEVTVKRTVRVTHEDEEGEDFEMESPLFVFCGPCDKRYVVELTPGE